MRGRRRGLVADCVGGTVGSGGCATESTAPGAHSGTPSCIRVSLARALSLMRVGTRLSGWLGQRLHVAALVQAGRRAVGLIGGA